MLIVCPSCATTYQVEPASLGATGRSVRCVRCRTVWFASNTEAMADIARAHRDDIAALRADDPSGVPEEPPTPPTADEPTIEAAPPLAPHQDPVEAEPQPADGAPEAPIRDDRGPAPLPEPRDYQLPEPSAAPVEQVIAPASPPQDEAALKPSDTVDIETLAARRMRRPPRRARRTPAALSTAILLLIAINAGLIAWRSELVRILPQTASFYAAIGLPVNLRELVFADIVTQRETHDDVQVLVVEGTIKSLSRRVSEVPRLRFALRSGDGREIYTWTALPEHKAIAPGGSIPFRSRLASPPPGTHAVLVRFFNRRDLGAGIQ